MAESPVHKTTHSVAFSFISNKVDERVTVDCCRYPEILENCNLIKLYPSKGGHTYVNMLEIYSMSVVEVE